MAINNDINNGILTLITKGASLSTSYQNVYIGLLTQLPSDANHMSGANKDWTEVDFILEDQETHENVSTGYGRYQLSRSLAYNRGAHGETVISSNYPRWDSNEKACVIVNDGDDMMFPNIVETLDASVSWKVYGFGLFSAATDGIMIAYGKLVDANGDDDSVTLQRGSVPIFYKNNFKLMLKDGDTTAAQENN